MSECSLKMAGWQHWQWFDFFFLSALEEARDINMYLRPIRHQFEDFEQAEFDECEPYLAPLMHTVCLIWTHSQYYNTPARIIVLLQEMCNMIINQVLLWLYSYYHGFDCVACLLTQIHIVEASVIHRFDLRCNLNLTNVHWW